MSIKIMLNIVAQCKRKASEKLMLIVLSEFANDKGSCYPSFETLAGGCNVSTRQAQNIIYKLIAEGDISASRREGGSNVYQFLRYMQPVTRETHCVTPPTKFSTNTVEDVVVTHEISNTTHETHFVTPPTKFSDTYEAGFVPDMSDFHLTHEMDFVPPTKFLGDTHEILSPLPTKPISYEPKDKPIEPKPLKPKNKNFVVAPVGDDTAPTPLLVSETITLESKDTHQTSEVVKPTQSVTPTIEGLPKHKLPPQTNSVDNTTIQTNTPPIAPPHADKVRVLTDHQKMVGAIVKAFGWSFNKMTKNNRGLVGKVARELLEASATPDQIPTLYEFCKGQKWSNGIFSPAALSSQWANFCAHQNTESTGEVFRMWTPPAGYVGVKFAYPPRIGDTIPEVELTPEEEQLTPAQMREQLDQILKKMVDKMTIEETPIPDDDPMKEVLIW